MTCFSDFQSHKKHPVWLILSFPLSLLSLSFLLSFSFLSLSWKTKKVFRMSTARQLIFYFLHFSSGRSLKDEEESSEVVVRGERKVEPTLLFHKYLKDTRFLSHWFTMSRLDWASAEKIVILVHKKWKSSSLLRLIFIPSSFSFIFPTFPFLLSTFFPSYSSSSFPPFIPPLHPSSPSLFVFTMLAQKIITKDEMIYELMSLFFHSLLSFLISFSFLSSFSFSPFHYACLISVVTFMKSSWFITWK